MFSRIIHLTASDRPIGLLGLYTAENETRVSFVHKNGHPTVGYAFSTVPAHFADNIFELQYLRRQMQLNYGARLVLTDDYAANKNKMPQQARES